MSTATVEAEVVEETQIRRFRVLRGRHREGGKTYGKGMPDGDVVETKNDLSRHNGSDPTMVKFLDITYGSPEALPSEVQRQRDEIKELKAQLAALQSGQTVSDNSDGDNKGSVSSGEAVYMAMTIPALREYAQDNEIDLGDATRKDDIIAAIMLAEGH